MLRFAQLIETLEHFHERFLRDFLGVFALAAHEEAVLKHLGLERLDKTVEGFGLTGQERPRKVRFGVIHTSILSGLQSYRAVMHSSAKGDMSPRETNCILSDEMNVRFAILLLLLARLYAQNGLSLKGAVDAALKNHPSMEAGAARVDAATEGVRKARSGYLPKLDYTESWTRSDNPVFVFGSLLEQHRFGEQNFQLGPLNRPDALNNFQSQIAATQSLYDGGLTRAQVRSAGTARDLRLEQKRATAMDLTGSVVRAYFGLLLADAELKSAREAVRSAESDLERAASILAAGMSTDADVLSIRVHLADMRQQEIGRKYDVEIARASLNELLGAPLDTPRELTTPLEERAELAPADRARTAVEERPETRETRLAADVAGEQSSVARAAFKPRVSLRFAFEADRQRFIDRGGANWLAGASFEWNLFNGFADRAREAEAAQAIRAAKADARQADAAVRVGVRRAEAEMQSANEQLAVAAAAVALAEESLRITKNRYENGMNTVTDLLRNETALLDARTRQLGAVYGQRVAAANLELASGTLTGDSDVLK